MLEAIRRLLMKMGAVFAALSVVHRTRRPSDTEYEPHQECADRATEGRNEPSLPSNVIEARSIL